MAFRKGWQRDSEWKVVFLPPKDRAVLKKLRERSIQPYLAKTLFWLRPHTEYRWASSLQYGALILSQKVTFHPLNREMSWIWTPISWSVLSLVLLLPAIIHRPIFRTFLSAVLTPVQHPPIGALPTCLRKWQHVLYLTLSSTSTEKSASKCAVHHQRTRRLRNAKMLSLPTLPRAGLLIQQPASFH